MMKVWKAFWSRGDQPFGLSVHKTLKDAIDYFNDNDPLLDSKIWERPEGIPMGFSVHQINLGENTFLARQLAQKPSVFLKQKMKMNQQVKKTSVNAYLSSNQQNLGNGSDVYPPSL